MLLPNEMMEKILVVHSKPLSVVVYRFVCRQWRDLLPLNLETARTFTFLAAAEGELSLIQWALRQPSLYALFLFYSSSHALSFPPLFLSLPSPIHSLSLCSVLAYIVRAVNAILSVHPFQYINVTSKCSVAANEVAIQIIFVGFSLTHPVQNVKGTLHCCPSTYRRVKGTTHTII